MTLRLSLNLRQLNVWCETKLLEKKKSLRYDTTHFWTCFSLKAHSLRHISSMICLLLSSWLRSCSVGRVASKALWDRACWIISTSASPAGRPWPGDELSYQRGKCYSQTTDNGVSHWWQHSLTLGWLQICTNVSKIIVGEWQNNHFVVLIHYLKGAIKSHILQSGIIN